jgi:hypothetical protein
MSDTQTQSYTPAQMTSGRRPHVLVWLLVLVGALGVLVAAVWFVGGPNEALRTLGLGDLFSASPFGVSGSGGSGGSSSSSGTQPAQSGDATTSATASTLPSGAQERMFAEQMQSRVALTDLVGGRIKSLSLGKAVTSGDSASVPLTAKYSNGSAVKGTLTLDRLNELWYFFSLSRDGSRDSGDLPSPGSFDSAVVETITNEQAQPGTQELITSGVLGGGFRSVEVDSVKMGPRTATVDVTLSGGDSPESKARLVCISKRDAGTTYWFVASFEKR